MDVLGGGTESSCRPVAALDVGHSCAYIPALDELSVLQMFVILIGFGVEYERWEMLGRPYPFERSYRGLEFRGGDFGYPSQPRLFSASVAYSTVLALIWGRRSIVASIHQCSSNGFHPFPTSHGICCASSADDRSP